MSCVPEGLDITYDHMVDPVLKHASEIQDFYNSTSVFITGASGFLGSLLTEKLLRTCPAVSRIYLLMRDKKGKSSEIRFQEMFKDIIFQRVLREQPNCAKKVMIITGDCELPGLGLSDEDRNFLIKNVNVVFHLAATVNFDEKLRMAMAVNVRSTRDILQLSREMTNLKAIIHVSTAYSNCIQLNIDENFYEPPISSDDLIRLTDILDDQQLEALTPHLLGIWPNTYVFTKAIAENIVKTAGKDLPIAIVRPSIVISTYKEPIAGWLNNYYGITGVTVGVGLGLIRTLHCDPNVVVDVVPADYCVNAILTAAWDVGMKNKISHPKSTTEFDEIAAEDTLIYNYVGSCQNPITFKKYMSLVEFHGLEHPSPLCFWYYCFTMHKNKYAHLLAMYLLHFLPGYLADFFCWTAGREARMMKLYKKIEKFSNVLSYFTMRQWRFTNKNVQNLWSKLNDTDKHLFEFDMNAFSWESYMQSYTPGMRVYLLKDPMNTIPEGHRRYKKLKIAHYVIVTLISLIFLKLLWIILSSLLDLVF